MNQSAPHTVRDASDLVPEADDRLSAYNRWFKEQVQVGLEQIDRGDLLSHEEVGKRIERLFRA